MNDYLSKPITAEQLRQTLNKWTGMLAPGSQPPPTSTAFKLLHQQQRAAPIRTPARAQPDAPAPMIPADTSVLDPEEGLRLAAGKADLAQDMLKMLLDGLPEDSRAISAALETGDNAALREIIHKLHGASRYCGVPQLRACCQAAETRLKQGDDSKAAVIAVLEAIERLLSVA